LKTRKQIEKELETLKAQNAESIQIKGWIQALEWVLA